MSANATASSDGHTAKKCIPEYCFHAFDALYCSLLNADPITPTFVNDECPLFVTWNIRSSRGSSGYHLRGCIGSFEPQSLHKGLAEYALISAFRDSRFRQVEKKELPRLQCGVSLLVEFEDAESYLDWTVGVHGIYISFPHPSLLPLSSTSSVPSPLSSQQYLPSTRVSSKRQLTATYLPQVMPEQGWSKVEAIDSAIRKAGWDGKITEEVRRSIHLRRYQSAMAEATWDEYVAWREANGAEATL
ncbi:AMMECR1 domain-containing protein [Auriculariales sp. MPI-PUGE-AT-0066]|nr:AMMECR1 domain-containing protein [Auriculariales sp. MPI-PUGE-AT-0066]